MVKNFLVAAAIFMGFLPTAEAVGSGNEILRLLQSSDPNENLKAYYYVKGLLDTDEIHLTIDLFASMPPKNAPKNTQIKFSRRYFCPPDGVNLKQIVDVSQRALESDPETRHEPAAIIIKGALLQVWPCRGNP